jgi:hypothetical protein
LYFLHVLGNYRERLTRECARFGSGIKSRDNFNRHKHFPRYTAHKYTYT